MNTTDPAILEKLKLAHENESHSYWRMRPIGEFVVADVRDVLSGFKGEVDAIITDEPYGVAKSTFGNYRGELQSYTNFKWEHESGRPLHSIIPWIPLASDALAEDGVLVCFGLAEWTTLFKDIVQYFGLHFKATIAWMRTGPPTHVRKNNFRSGYDVIWVASKTSRMRINFQEQQEMINWEIDQVCPECGINFPVNRSRQYDIAQWQQKFFLTAGTSNPRKVTAHPTEKPTWLIGKLLTIFSDEGDLVVDPFCGSGTIPITAFKMGRRFVASDIDPDYIKMCHTRFGEETNV